MTRAARVDAQAKINVWLHVGGVDAGGYHEIFTLFHRIDLADTVTVRARDDERRRCAHRSASGRPVDLGPTERNLAYRAAEAFREQTGWPNGFDIELTKRIPVGGGLGGGSADAGAVLRALNAIAPRPMAPQALLEMAARLGSDVAFLASEMVAAVGQGRGERLTPFIGTPPPADLVLVIPDFGIGTAEAYRWVDEAGPRSLDPGGSPDLLQPVADWGALDAGNDFEPAVESRHPVLGAIREGLAAAGARVARLSGSGSTVFGIFPQGVPASFEPPANTTAVRTRTSANVVQVEVLE